MSLQTGALWRGAGGTLDEASAFPYVELDFGYGDLVRTPFRKPFDAFQSRFVVGGGKGVSELVVLGRLYGKPLSESPSGAASFLITQGFAYLTNPAYDLGGQSVDVGIGSIKTLGRRTSLSFLAMGQVVPLAAISAEYVDINERDYDFGPAIGASFLAALRWYGDPVLRLFYHSSFIKSVNGSDATHYVDHAAGSGAVPDRPDVRRRWLLYGLHAQQPVPGRTGYVHEVSGVPGVPELPVLRGLDAPNLRHGRVGRAAVGLAGRGPGRRAAASAGQASGLVGRSLGVDFSAMRFTCQDCADEQPVYESGAAQVAFGKSIGTHVAFGVEVATAWPKGPPGRFGVYHRLGDGPLVSRRTRRST